MITQSDTPHNALDRITPYNDYRVTSRRSESLPSRADGPVLRGQARAPGFWGDCLASAHVGAGMMLRVQAWAQLAPGRLRARRPPAVPAFPMAVTVEFVKSPTHAIVGLAAKAS